RRIKGGNENTDDGGIDSPHSCLDSSSAPQGTPEGKNPELKKQPRKKNGNECESRARWPAERPRHGSPQVGCEGKQGAGDSLRGSISGQERVWIQPAGGNHRLG